MLITHGQMLYFLLSEVSYYKKTINLKHLFYNLKTVMHLFSFQDNQNNSFEIGYLIDKIFGIRLGAVIFAVFICLGKFEFDLCF